MGIILLVATVIPFALGGAAMQFVVAPAYRKAVAHAAQEQTRRLAEQVAWNVSLEANRLEKLAAWSEIRDLARRGVLSDEKSVVLNRQWATIPLGSESLRPLLQNVVARELRWWRDTDPGVSEIIATDAQGRLIAATGKPTDVLQADEHWWRASFAGGRGRVYVSDVRFDRSAGTQAFEIAVPIYNDAAPGSRVLGVAKMALNAPRLLESVRRARLGEGGEAMVVDHRGQILLPSPPGGLDAQVPQGPVLTMLRQQIAGTRIIPGGDGGLLTAWARVGLEPGSEGPGLRMPPLYVVTERSAGTAFETLRTVQFWMLLIGLTTVVLAVAVGSWLAEVLVVRQVRTLARGMRELARGDFERAEAIAARLCASDENPEHPSRTLART
jgi:hypothetical protein